jgi:hypothetical protein
MLTIRSSMLSDATIRAKYSQYILKCRREEREITRRLGITFRRLVR